MLERARAAGLPFSWIAGDSVYGAERAIQRWAEAHGIGYVLSVTTGQRLSLCPVADWFADQVAALPARTRVWRRLSAGEGAKGRTSTTGPTYPIAARRRASSAPCWCAARAPTRTG